MRFAVDPREVPDGQELAAGEFDEILHLVIEGEGLSVPLPRCRIESGEAAGRRLGTVLSFPHPGEVTSDIHRGTNLLEGLHLDVAFAHGAVEVAAHSPRHGGGVFGHGGLRLLGAGSAVVDGGKARVIGGDLGADVDLCVGVDDGAVAVEERRGRGRVVPRLGERTVAEAHRVLVLSRRREVDVPPCSVGPEARPDDPAVQPRVVAKLNTDRVGALEGPDEVTHLGEAHAHGLVAGAPGVVRALDHDAVVKV